jgi:hypothetical protein
VFCDPEPLRGDELKVTYSIDESKAHYITVDLDVWSRSRLDALAAAIGKRAGLRYVGPEGRVYGAHFGVRLHPDEDASRAIRALASVVRKLPDATRRLWDRAYRREFNIGIQAADEPSSFELGIQPNALRAVVELNATVVITVYAPHRPAPPKGHGIVRANAPRGRRTNGRT